jgi:hypothetical protein
MYCISRKYCDRYRWYYANTYCEAKRKADVKAGEGCGIVLVNGRRVAARNSEGVK